MTTRRLSTSAPPELSLRYGDSDYHELGFPHLGHDRDRVLGKLLKTNSAAVIAGISEQRPPQVVGQLYLGDPGPCRFTPNPVSVRISFPAT
jgi:hypothetical protein